jgi:transcriptional regulator with XRE-family HTH domain
VHEPHKIFGKNVVKLRTDKRLTQEKLAEKAEISHRYLQSIEAGKKQPSINVVGRIRKGLGCSWDELLTGV